MGFEKLGSLGKSIIIGTLFVAFYYNPHTALSIAAPKVFYVSNSGSDSNPGTIGSPFLTIQYAVGQMAPGDTILVRGGRYLGFAVGPPYSSTGLSWDQPNTLKAYPGETVTLHNPSSDNVILLNGIPGGTTNQYWVLKDFIIDGSDGLLTSGAGGSALIDGGGNYVRIENIELAYAPRVGIASGGSYWELINLNVHHARTLASDDTGHGLYWRGQHLLLDGGKYHDNTGYGLQIYNGGQLVSHSVVRNVQVYNNGTGHLRPHQHGVGGVVMGSGADNIIYNSLIYRNFGDGLDLDYRCGLYGDDNLPAPCEAFNNSIWGNEGSAVALGSNDTPMCNPFSTPPGGPCVHAVVQNNIVFGNGNTVYNVQAIATISNNLAMDPSFTNAAGADFTLKPLSSAIGGGLNLSSIFTTDFAGKPRAVGKSSFDIGAFEYVPASSDITAPAVSITVITP